MRALFIGCLLLAGACTQRIQRGPREDPPAGDAVGEIAAEFSKGRHREVLRLLSEKPELLDSDARARYLAGHAWMRLHRPDLAKPHLGGDFEGYPGWETRGSLLERIAVVEQLRPPARTAGIPSSLRVFADDTPWIREVLRSIPDFSRRAQEVFGPDLPTIDLYLFQSRDRYVRFYRAMFGVEVSTWWQNGTGDSNVVVFCQEDRQGRPIGPPGAPRGLGDVLHEYGHALLNTLYGDRYLRQVPQWLDEGFADFVARPYYEELFETSGAAIRKFLAKSPAPGVEDLSRRLYQRDSFVRYGIARFMVEEMTKGRETGVVRDLLRRAATDGDFEAAVRGTTGSDPAELLDRTLARFR